jgi:non-canonical purine NTP pyrophosphatase (RdgB/HAM1 family)
MRPHRHALAPGVVLATSNTGKLREMREILAPWQVDVRPLAEFSAGNADETGLTFVENAILKARYASAAASLPAIADDSGLEVDVLHGAPGVYSVQDWRWTCCTAHQVSIRHVMRGLRPMTPQTTPGSCSH